MNSSRTLKDRILGCIIGGAIGDAFGAPYEGAEPPVEIDPDIVPLLTDDTVLTLATCEAIVAERGVDPAAIAGRCAESFRIGEVIGIGASTYKALSELAEGGHWALCGCRGERAAGNGAAMRIAPLAFFLDLDGASGRRTLRDVARITHHNEEAYVGALAIALAVRIAWKGHWLDDGDLLGVLIPRLPDSRVRDRLKNLAELESTLPFLQVAERCGTSGYVAESVPMALWATQQVRSVGFESMIGEVVACGGDTDTIASMAGQVAGALIGMKGLPQDLVRRLPEWQAIMDVAERMAAVIDETL